LSWWRTIVEYVYGNGDSTMRGIFAGTVTLWVCYGATGIAKTYVGSVVTALIIPAVVVATYRNYYGTKYIVDLDATAD